MRDLRLSPVCALCVPMFISFPHCCGRACVLQALRPEALSPGLVPPQEGGSQVRQAGAVGGRLLAAGLRGRGQLREQRQAQPAGLRALEGRQAGGALLGQPVGGRPTRRAAPPFYLGNSWRSNSGVLADLGVLKSSHPWILVFRQILLFCKGRRDRETRPWNQRVLLPCYKTIVCLV